MASGLAPVSTFINTFIVCRSKIATLFSWPAVMKPLPLGAIAMPCTPGDVGNAADDLVGGGVDDDDFGAVAQIQTLGGAVDREVVETAEAADVDFAGRCVLPIGADGGDECGDDGEGLQHRASIRARR